MNEETSEIQQALKSGNQPKIEEELGDLLFAAVNLARFLQVDPEIALKNANAKFVRRFQQMEGLAAESGRAFEDVPRPEKENLWVAAKLSEPARSEPDPAPPPIPGKQNRNSRKAGQRR
jgi:ATP diphosphatase